MSPDESQLRSFLEDEATTVDVNGDFVPAVFAAKKRSDRRRAVAAVAAGAAAFAIAIPVALNTLGTDRAMDRLPATATVSPTTPSTPAPTATATTAASTATSTGNVPSTGPSTQGSPATSRQNGQPATVDAGTATAQAAQGVPAINAQSTAPVIKADLAKVTGYWQGATLFRSSGDADQPGSILEDAWLPQAYVFADQTIAWTGPYSSTGDLDTRIRRPDGSPVTVPGAPVAISPDKTRLAVSSRAAGGGLVVRVVDSRGTSVAQHTFDASTQDMQVAGMNDGAVILGGGTAAQAWDFTTDTVHTWRVPVLAYDGTARLATTPTTPGGADGCTTITRTSTSPFTPVATICGWQVQILRRGAYALLTRGAVEDRDSQFAILDLGTGRLVMQSDAADNLAAVGAVRVTESAVVDVNVDDGSHQAVVRCELLQARCSTIASAASNNVAGGGETISQWIQAD